jgi:feruloyl-CoA hydratase/lyase
VPHDRLWDEVNDLAECLKGKNPAVLKAAKEAYRYIGDMNWEEAGAWLYSKSKELDAATGKTWKKGVEQFKAKEYRPGLGQYDWKKEEAKA